MPAALLLVLAALSSAPAFAIDQPAAEMRGLPPGAVTPERPGAAGGQIRIPAEIPVRRERAEADGRGTSYSRLVVAGLAIAAALVAFRASRRKIVAGRQGSSSPGWLWWLARDPCPESLQVVKSRRLTAQASIHVVRWSGEEWLLGCGPGGVRVLGRRPAAEGKVAPPQQESKESPP